MVNQSTRILFLSFLWIAPQLLSGQSVEWSNQQKVKAKTNYSRVLGENASGLYIVRSKSRVFTKDLTVEKYKSNLAFENSIELEQPGNSVVERLLLLNDGIAVFESQRNDSLPEIDLLWWKLDGSLHTNNQRTVLARIDAGLFKTNTDIYIKSSANKSNYAFMYLTSGAEEKNTCVLHLHGYDQGLHSSYVKTFHIKSPADDVVISGFECDNEGNAYLLIDFPRAAEKKKKGNDVRDFFLYSYYKSMDKTLEYELKNDSAYINDLALAINNYNKSVCVAGVYSNANDHKAVGSFEYSIDATSGLLLSKWFEPFSSSFNARVTGTMLNETGSYLSDLYVRNLIPRSDGGCVLVLEKYYESRQTYTYYANGFPQTASRVMYNYDEIIVLSKDSEGKTRFQDFIKKSQSSMNDGGYYSSFILQNSNDKLSFIYNSDVNNEGDVMITSINPLGQADTKILVKALSYYVLVMPPESKQISGNSSLICTLKDRRFTLMKLTY